MVRPRSGPPDGRPAASLSAAPRSGAEPSYRAPATPHSFLFAQIVSTAAAAASSLPPRLLQVQGRTLVTPNWMEITVMKELLVKSCGMYDQKDDNMDDGRLSRTLIPHSRHSFIFIFLPLKFSLVGFASGRFSFSLAMRVSFDGLSVAFPSNAAEQLLK